MSDAMRAIAIAIAVHVAEPERLLGTLISIAWNTPPECRTLAPLNSVADFCHAVKRTALAQIGEADEAFGLGPCWEMDYNVRAARAGFHGLWACAAYVRRAPAAQRRLREEAARLDLRKRQYQDKYYGARLRRERSEYRSRRRGDACSNVEMPRGLCGSRRGLVGQIVKLDLAAGPYLAEKSFGEWLRNYRDKLKANGYEVDEDGLFTERS